MIRQVVIDENGVHEPPPQSSRRAESEE